jgi:hypothetical protein
VSLKAARQKERDKKCRRKPHSSSVFLTSVATV